MSTITQNTTINPSTTITPNTVSNLRKTIKPSTFSISSLFKSSLKKKKLQKQILNMDAERQRILQAAEAERQRLLQEENDRIAAEAAAAAAKAEEERIAAEAEEERIAAEAAAAEAKLRQECQNSDLHVKIEIKAKQTSVGFGTIDYFFTKNNNDERMTNDYVLNTTIKSEDALNFGGIKTPEKYEFCRGYVIQKLILSVLNNIEYSTLDITLQSDTEEMVISKTDGILYSGENEIDFEDTPFNMVTKSS